MLKRLIRHFRRPIGVDISFDSKSYKLGEMINTTVQLTAKCDLMVGQASVDLVCEESYAERYIKKTPLRYKTGFMKRKEAELIDVIPEQVVKEFKESFIHSRHVIFENQGLESKKVATFRAKLPIKREPPPHALGGKLKWFVVAVAEVDGQEHTSTSHGVEVQLH